TQRDRLAADQPWPEMSLAQTAHVPRRELAELAFRADGFDVERPAVRGDVEPEYDRPPGIRPRARAAVDRRERRNEVEHDGLCEILGGIHFGVGGQRVPRALVVSAGGCGVARDRGPVAEDR